MQVIASWNPAGARRPVLDEAPVFHPTEEVLYILLLTAVSCFI